MTKTTMDGPVHLPDPLAAHERTKPRPGCKVCAALALQRAAAADRGDWSTVSDRNVEIGRHPGEHH